MRTRRQIVVSTTCWTPVAVAWLLGVVMIGASVDQAIEQRETYKIGPVASAELFDPSTGRWLRTGPMTASHSRHDAYAVDGGAVLLSSTLFEPPMAERFDAKSGTFSRVQGTLPRQSGPARLSGGKLLFPLSTQRGRAALFDFATNTSGVTAPYVVGRCHRQAEALIAHGSASPEDLAARLADACLGGGSFASATTLSSGKVLALDGSDAQIYDPAADTWVETTPPLTPRAAPILRRLASAKILVFGGYTVQLGEQALADPHTTELYDPDTATWQILSPTHGFISELCSETLPGDRIFAIGSAGPELFENGEWRRLPSAANARCEPQACTFLRSGALLLLGGSSETGVPQPLQLLAPAAATWQPGAAPGVQRAYAAAVTLVDGRVLLSGGEETTLLCWFARWQHALLILLGGVAWLGVGVGSARLLPPRFRPPLRGLAIVCGALALLGFAAYLWLMWAMTGALRD